MRLPNGTDIIPPIGSEGLGTLKISNYTENDAAVKLKTSADSNTVRFVYVQAMSEVTITKIVPGVYVLQFATGRFWNPSEMGFSRDQGFAAFDSALTFSETTVGQKTIYSAQEVTLHPVPNGNVRKKAISAEEFTGNSGLQPTRVQDIN